jgi:proline iminopeptidase
MAEMHDCADESLTACGLSGPVDAVGHSMAGLVLLAYAIERPERIRRLVLVGTGSGGPAYMGARGALWNRTHPHFPGLAARAILHLLWPARGPERIMNNFIERHSFHDRRLAEPKSVTLLDWVRAREGRTDWHWVAKRLDYSSRLGEIAVPTIIVCGRHDPQYPPGCSEELAAGIKGAELVWFESSGHYPYIEEPQAFFAAVGEFLNAAKGSRRGETYRIRGGA